MSLVLSNKGKGMQSSSEQPLVGEEHCVTTLITAAKETRLQSALRSFAIVCDYMETGLFAIVCDLRSAIRDRLRSFAIIWKPAFIKVTNENKINKFEIKSYNSV